MEWKCLNSEYVIDNSWMKVRKDTVELPNGVIIPDYYVTEKKSVSLVVAMDSENRVMSYWLQNINIHLTLFISDCPAGHLTMKMMIL